MSPLKKLNEFGQSPWLDFIRRGFIEDGSLQKLIDEDGIRGVTSNPAIFEQAIAGSTDYDEAIMVLTGEGKSAEEIVDQLSIEDVGAAADLFRPVYDATDGLDGYVSLEVSPHLARDTKGTVADARRLWKALDRPNVMIKIPATVEGVPAIQECIAEGINVNVTLLFSVTRYTAVAEAYLAGISERAAAGHPPRVASVASFFVSRVDSLVDPMLESAANPMAKELMGEVAVANSLCAYAVFQYLFGHAGFAELKGEGAWVQRLLWASTSAKNPKFSKTKYVESLIGPDTVNTLPLETIEAYRESGHPAERVTGSVMDGEIVMNKFRECGFDIEEVATELENQAIQKFVDPYDKLLAAVDAKRQSLIGG